MHTHASNFELVEPLAKPEQTLNRRLRRRNRRVPFERRKERPEHPRIVFPPILDINYFCHFLENYHPIDDEPMWAADRVVAPTPGSAITIPETANEFAIKETFMDLKTKLESSTKNHQASIQNLEAKFDRLTDKQSARPSRSLPSSTQPNPKVAHLNLTNHRKLEMSMYAVFTWSGKSYDPPTNPNNQQNDSETPINFDKLVSNKHKLEQISSAFLSNESSPMMQNKVPPKLGDPESFLIPCTFSKAFSYNALADLGASINLMAINVIDEILEEDFDALLDKGSKILYSTEKTLLEEKLFAEFDEFIAMNIEENSESEPESDEEEQPLPKITFDTTYKSKHLLKNLLWILN
ncbi:hypothetical protein Tco_0618828 [Tanacetum coccineum]